ncbi:hypothetical protein GCM10023314_18590 [Algibacter agarivorans]|uniref:BNR repeat-containing family member n=2 Tax=Algibacter agarivorans TaxID=1109741 RepID=A0ABP9GJV4_9FLAO
MLLSLVGFAQNRSKVDYFASNALGNPVTGNAGECYNGVTYVSYQGPLEDPYVAAYHHKTKTWVGPFKAGTSLMGKNKSRRTDNHGKPTLVIDSKGYIHIVFGGHSGTPDLGENPLGNYHYGKQIHIVTKNPLDISSWQEVDNISPFGTYSQFIKMDKGDLYLFYRHGAHRSNWVYQLSKDDGLTFSDPVSIIKTKQTTGTKENPVICDSWYLHFSKGKNNDIIATYNYHVCKGPHHDGERHNVYYMRFDTNRNECYNVRNQKLILPVTKEEADTMTLIKNTEERWTHNGIARLDKFGNPHVTSYEGDYEDKKHGGIKTLQHYYWTGQEWKSNNKTRLPEGARGEMLINSNNQIKLLLGDTSRKKGDVAWWVSDDNGNSFKKDKVLLKSKKGKFLLSNFIRNAHPDAKIIVAEKKGNQFVKMYLLGDNGPIYRSKKESEAVKE